MTALLAADEAARLRPGEQLVIVRAGDKVCCPCPHVGQQDHEWRFVAPQAWVALTGPCPTCADSKWGPGRVFRPQNERASRSDHFVKPCPDCRDGRRIVPLYTESPESVTSGDDDEYRRNQAAAYMRFMVALTERADDPVEPGGGLLHDGRATRLVGEHPLTDGRVLVGRGSIEVVPVVDRADDEFHRLLRPHICIDTRLRQILYAADGLETELALDPLPVPGRDWGIVIDCVEVLS